MFGRHFILVTDHKSLLYIFGKKKGIPQIAANRLQRWAYFLSVYDYDISFVKSGDHGNTDGLSRLPLMGNDLDSEDDYDCFKFIQTGCIPLSERNLKVETSKDKTLSSVVKYTLFNWPIEVDNDLKPYASRKN